jgi:Fe-S-cluster-containing hydrogenase component 2
MVEMPAIEPEKCNGCGLCISVCPCKVLVLVDNVVTRKEKNQCHQCTRWCAKCDEVCPTGAISYSFEIVTEEK